MSFFVVIGNSQNLVTNPGFEQYATCPYYVSQVSFSLGWMQPTHGTSDYFNACLGVPFSVSVPDNQFGVQQPTGGNGYAKTVQQLRRLLFLQQVHIRSPLVTPTDAKPSVQ